MSNQHTSAHNGLCPVCSADTEASSCRKVGTASQIDNIAMQDEVARMMRKKPQPVLEIRTTTKRPPIGTLGDVLKQTADYAATNGGAACYTRIEGYSEAVWHGVPDGEPDQLELSIEGATACLEAHSAVTIFIRQGVPVATARALLKATVRELKAYPTLEPFTPTDPAPNAGDSDSVPF